MSGQIKCSCCKRAFDDPLSAPVGLLDLDVRSYNAVLNNILRPDRESTVGDLVKYSASELLELRGMGKQSLVDIRKRLAWYGLSLRDERNENE